MTSGIHKLIKDAIRLGSFSEMAHMYAASAAINKPIRSYYPPQAHPELSSEPFTRTIVGRGAKQSNPAGCIMWTSMCIPQTLNSFSPNHFVPLVKKNESTSNIVVCLDDSEQELNCTNTENNAGSIMDTYDMTNNITDTSTDMTIDSNIVNDHATVCTDSIDQAQSFMDTTDMSNINDDDVTDLTEKNTESNMVTDVTNSDCSDTNIATASADTSNVSDASEMTVDSKGGVSNATGELGCTFLEINKAVHLILEGQSDLEHIPRGLKENVYFLIKNDTNFSKRKSNVKSSFPDDCGVWDSNAGATPKTYFLLGDNGFLHSTHFYKGKFCSLTRVKGKNGKTERQYTPLDPQPDPQKVVVVHRYYTNFKTDKSYKKRVTWLGEGGLTSSFALIEYLGSHPGLLPHGNSKDQKSEYLRTPNFVMEEAEQMLIHDKPKAVYERMKMKYDELTRPTGLQQLRDKKKELH